MGKNLRYIYESDIYMYKTEPLCCNPESNTKIKIYLNEREKLKEGRKKRQENVFNGL